MTGKLIVAVSGPIGAGKSTLVRGLAPLLSCSIALERIDENPYFERFCVAPKEWAFHSQLSFMLGSASDAVHAAACGRRTVAERPIQEQLDIFCAEQRATGLMTADEFAQLERLVDLVEVAGGRPDVLVLLTAPIEVLQERVALRARAGEDAYEPEYIHELQRAYSAWSASWTQSPVVIVDSQTEDVRDPKVLESIAERVLAASRR